MLGARVCRFSGQSQTVPGVTYCATASACWTSAPLLQRPLLRPYHTSPHHRLATNTSHGHGSIAPRRRQPSCMPPRLVNEATISACEERCLFSASSPFAAPALDFRLQTPDLQDQPTFTLSLENTLLASLVLLLLGPVNDNTTPPPPLLATSVSSRPSFSSASHARFSDFIPFPALHRRAIPHHHGAQG